MSALPSRKFRCLSNERRGRQLITIIGNNFGDDDGTIEFAMMITMTAKLTTLTRGTRRFLLIAKARILDRRLGNHRVPPDDDLLLSSKSAIRLTVLILPQIAIVGLQQ